MVIVIEDFCEGVPAFASGEEDCDEGIESIINPLYGFSGQSLRVSLAKWSHGSNRW